ncbi:MAG: hypothetical protein ABSB30_09365 [Terracidiphilus sp.]|jgi:hypothetical protein
MKRVSLAVAAMMIAVTAGASGAGPAPQPKQVRAEGCVEAGVEMRCLVLKDVKSGKLYNVFFTEPRPNIGDGIEFTGVPFDGVTYCMQGTPVKVTDWARKDSLNCNQGEAPR